MPRALVTGGAGFIGSYLVDRLMKEGYGVTVLDNLSSGSLDNLKEWLRNPRFKFVKEDLKDAHAIKTRLGQVELVFHLAANPEVKVGETGPRIHFNENLVATFNLLEAIRRNRTVKAVVFASTSTVYGEASKIPTSENYGPLIPISTYGASKLGCEALICSHAFAFGLRALILRFANVVGPRSNHGIIMDFINNLKSNPRKLKILGDGSQRKSYVYIQDCVEAIMLATDSFLKSRDRVQVFNVGSADWITVKRIADVVVKELGLENVKISFTGGVDGGRGWLGDVKMMRLSIDRLLNAGWRPRYNSEEAVRLTTKDIVRCRP